MLTEKEIKTVLYFNDEKRYYYSIKKIIELKKIWSLYDDGWALTEDDNGNIYLPIWPTKEFAELCVKDEWKNYIPNSIDLDDFFTVWLEKLMTDNMGLSIFYTPYHRGVFVSCNRFKRSFLDAESPFEDINIHPLTHIYQKLIP